MRATLALCLSVGCGRAPPPAVPPPPPVAVECAITWGDPPVDEFTLVSEAASEPGCPIAYEEDVLARACWREVETLSSVGTPVAWRTWYHPDHGREIRSEIDGRMLDEYHGEPPDGVVDAVVTHVWSEDGRQERARLEHLGDGTLDDGRCTSYAANGWEAETWTWVDGAWWPTLRREWAGDLVLESCVGAGCALRSVTDVDPLGRPLERREYTADALTGRAIWQWTELADGGSSFVQCPEAADAPRERGTLDAQGRIIAQSWAYSPEYAGNVVTYTTYDAEGRVDRVEVIADGEQRYLDLYSYDADGTLARLESTSRMVDWRGEPAGAQVWVYEYDALGRELLRSSRVEDVGGALSLIEETTTTYGEDGILAATLHTYDGDGDGVPEFSESVVLPPVTCPGG